MIPVRFSDDFLHSRVQRVTGTGCGGEVPVADDVLGVERDSFFKRTSADCVLGLALIHHLRITGNWSIRQIVSLFDKLAPIALVEFVPLNDEQTQRLTRGREEIYQDWTIDNVQNAFQGKYTHCNVMPLPDSGRVLLELSR